MVFLGTSGYQFDDWIGTAYPEGMPKSRMLKYYSAVWQFSTVELNFTYYGMPTDRTMLGMLNKVSADPLVFTVKAFGGVTHKHWRSGNRNTLKNDSEEFIEALRPLRESSRLGALLFQFPSSFRPDSANNDYLESLSQLYQRTEVPLAIEFRHKDWDVQETYDMLDSLRMVPVVVDEPGIGSLFPYAPRSSSGHAYFRFHGRNSRWFTASATERYNYDYSESELREFASDVLEFSHRGLDVFVFFNNCYMGRAVHNALRFREILGGA